MANFAPTTLEIMTGPDDPDWDCTLITGGPHAEMLPGVEDALLNIMRLSTQAHRNRQRLLLQVEAINQRIAAQNAELVAQRSALLDKAEALRLMGNELNSIAHVQIHKKPEPAVRRPRVSPRRPPMVRQRDAIWEQRQHDLAVCSSVGRHPDGVVPGCACICHTPNAVLATV